MFGIAKGTVISTLKKADTLTQVNPNFYKLVEATAGELEVRLEAILKIEADEQWSYVGDKYNQHWLWLAVDYATNTVIAYVFGKRRDVVFEELKKLLDPFGITRYYTDDWGGLMNAYWLAHQQGRIWTQYPCQNSSLTRYRFSRSCALKSQS